MNKIFISGLYRSGTTLVSRILNNHPEVESTYDCVHFMRFCYNKFNPISKRYLDVISQVHKRIKSRLDIELDIDEIISIFKNTKNLTYASLYDSIMKVFLLRNNKKSIWCDKSNVCWTHLLNFINMYPDEGYGIMVIRDPRDVVCSYKKYTVEQGYKYLDAAFASVSALNFANKIQEDEILSKKIIIIKYEDLVKNSTKKINWLMRKIDLNDQDISIDLNNFTDRTGGVWKNNSSYQDLESGISTSPVGRYRKILSSNEINFIQTICQDSMEKHNYSINMLNQKDIDYSLFLKDELLNSRWEHWLETNEGVESYPSSPPLYKSSRQIYPISKS